MNNKALTAIILAAGKGTRMKSRMAKVLHPLFFRPMVGHVIESVLGLTPGQVIIVVGHQHQSVREQLRQYRVEFAEQQRQLGTGHAVLAAEDLVDDRQRDIMILCGDTPLIRPQTLSQLHRIHTECGNDLTLLTTKLEDPTNYGRIVTDFNGNISGIIEEKDATEEQRKITEINGGIYCVRAELLFRALKNVSSDNAQGEIYLTDIVKIFVDDKLQVGRFTVVDPKDVLGVNSRRELAEAQRELQLRRNMTLMDDGVSFISPETTRISLESTVMADTIVEPCVHISGSSHIGHCTTIEQGSVLKNCIVGDNVFIGAGCYLENITIDDGARIPPLTKQIIS
ncbi:bifunctional UDP-N-acetylglucosamine diphosphorylase/glucosamine-1-phosphate N-acetyltransferase GlmU [Desulforhopalus singaporensis]|uniref:UDP-N-acetylglucosamine pyrophosphorylase n=1 Tax=Desulforhopalus singaporensis TaxID=91360 RepID=A0A1H0M965_9BACT|nr:sugar phosphate nucleotidyltransferase [Desulforhopalus singaporensis]SDO76660.1 UDP-N-acetylglucosamine pyrophosphorylase [Desulforhopalus singaporensis]